MNKRTFSILQLRKPSSEYYSIPFSSILEIKYKKRNAFFNFFCVVNVGFVYKVLLNHHPLTQKSVAHTKKQIYRIYRIPKPCFYLFLEVSYYYS